MPEPIVKLETNGQASVISYNVPEPTSYAGKNIIELEFDAKVFTAKAKEIPASRKKTVTEKELTLALDNAVNIGVVDSTLLPNISSRLISRTR